MEKIVLFILSAFLLFSCGSSESLLDEDNNDNKSIAKFKVASYNIRNASDKDDNAWENRKNPVSELILRHDFYIVGIQEPYQIQINDLNDLLVDYDRVIAPYASKSYLGIYYKKNQFKALEDGIFRLSETPDVPSIGWDADELRIVHWARFVHKESNKQFYFFNTHFYWKNETARKNSGPLSARKIKEIAGKTPVIFVGDLNSRPTTTQVDRLKVDLNDTFDISESPLKDPNKTNLSAGVFEGPFSVRLYIRKQKYKSFRFYYS